MHGEGSPVYSPSALVPTLPTATCRHHIQQLAWSRSQEVPSVSSAVFSGLPGAGRCPGSQNCEPCVSTPPRGVGGVPGGGPGRGTGGGQVEEGGPATRPGRSPGPRRAGKVEEASTSASKA